VTGAISGMCGGVPSSRSIVAGHSGVVSSVLMYRSRLFISGCVGDSTLFRMNLFKPSQAKVLTVGGGGQKLARSASLRAPVC